MSEIKTPVNQQSSSRRLHSSTDNEIRQINGVVLRTEGIAQMRIVPNAVKIQVVPPSQRPAPTNSHIPHTSQHLPSVTSTSPHIPSTNLPHTSPHIPTPSPPVTIPITMNAPPMPNVQTMFQAPRISTREPQEMRTSQDKPLYSSIREYKLAFHILKTDHPNLKVPKLKETDNITLVDTLFKSTRRSCKCANIVIAIKIGVVAICFFLELVGSRVFGMKVDAFTKIQYENLHMFDPMIDEFCKKWVPDTETPSEPWPLEIRMVMTIFMNFVIFYAGKVVTDSGDVLGLVAKAMANVTPGGDGQSASPFGMLQSLLGNMGGIVGPLISIVTGQGAGTTVEPNLSAPAYEDV